MQAWRFLFGSGWRTLWHLALYAFAALLVVGIRMQASMIPGAGPQGGEAAFLFILTGWAGLVFVSFAVYVEWLGVMAGSCGRAALAVAVFVVLAAMSLPLIFFGAQSVNVTAPRPHRLLGFAVLALVIGGCVLAGLAARFSASRRTGSKEVAP